MPILKTEIEINALPHTVWAIMDNLPAYPEWNRLVPDLTGLTVVGETVRGTLKQPSTPDIPLSPVLTRIVGARELRWLTEAPETGVFRAEHVFVLTPLAGGRTHLLHEEYFDGVAVADMWDGIQVNARAAYEAFNRDLKARAEAHEAEAPPQLHPALSAKAGDAASLLCRCASNQVSVTLSAPVSHTHLCGCSKCWRPEGASLAMIGVVPAGAAEVTSGAEKLAVVDEAAPIRRAACKECGTHMLGTVADPKHHFFGLDFVHPELAGEGAPKPEFAAFVSSLVETGTTPSRMTAIRRGLAAAGLAAYDAFSPELMDLIAWHKVKMRA